MCPCCELNACLGPSGLIHFQKLRAKSPVTAGLRAVGMLKAGEGSLASGTIQSMPGGALLPSGFLNVRLLLDAHAAGQQYGS